MVFKEIANKKPNNNINIGKPKYVGKNNYNIMPCILEIYIHKIFVVLYANNFYYATDL